MDKERFEKQLSFILEADKEKSIFRQTHLISGERCENDAEHAWHLALMIYLLREYSSEKIDLARTMIMAIIHDIVEIDAGDTYAYDTVAVESQRERELKAAERLFGLLPEDQAKDLRAIFDEFEEAKTPEAIFARSMDCFQPLLLNNSNGGGDWRRHGVRREQVVKRQAKTKLSSSELYDYSISVIDENVKKGNIKE